MGFRRNYLQTLKQLEANRIHSCFQRYHGGAQRSGSCRDPDLSRSPVGRRCFLTSLNFSALSGESPSMLDRGTSPPSTLALNNSSASPSTPICRPSEDGAISREARRIMRSRCSLLGDCTHTCTEISLSNIFLPPYLPLALFCLPNLLLFGLPQRPPAAVLHRADKRSPEPSCTCSFLLLNGAHQSRRCLPTGGARPLSAPHVQPETIDQQAAGAGAGLEVRPVTGTSEFTPRKRWALFGQVRTPFNPSKVQRGTAGSENSLEQQEMSGKHRGNRGEDSHTQSAGAAAGRTKLREEVSRSRVRMKTNLANFNKMLRVQEA